ncbi:MAG: DUF4175 family protein [Bacteroidota bacterium]|jgi:hypothetical protein
MTNEITQIIKQIHARIDETRKRMYREELLRAVVNAFSITMLVWTVLMMAESIGQFNQTVRSVLFYGFWIFAAALFLWFTGKPLLRFLKILPQADDEEMAKIIGAKFEKIGDRLENALDLADMLRDGNVPYSPELVEVSLEHFQRSTGAINFGSAVSFAHLRQLVNIVSAVTAVVGIISLIPGSPFGQAAERIWNHDRQYEVPALFQFIISPGNTDIVKGEPVLVTARLVPTTAAPAGIPEEISFSLNREGVTVPETITLKKDSSGSFRYQFSSLTASVRYQFRAGDLLSDTYSLTVLDRPFIRSLRISLTPPSYTKLARQTLEENIGDVVALPGTVIHWTIAPSKVLKSASIIFPNGSRLPLSREGNEYTGSYRVRRPATYSVALDDTNGIASNRSINYKITVIPDAYPTVDIVSPGKNMDVTQTMQMPLDFKIGDDFGITQLQLAFRLVQSRYEKPEKSYGVIIPFDTLLSANETVEYDWDMSVLGLVPEDVVEYYAEVTDNDAVSGPKSARSKTYLLRLPSLEEVFSDADVQHTDAAKNLESSLKQAEELKKNIEELSQDMKKNQQMDWQKQNKAEEIAKKYQEIQKKIDDVNKQVDNMTQTLQRNTVLSKETLEKYSELQKMMQELNSPEFQQALQRMQQAMQNASPEQMREAMQQVQFSEEQFRSSIERTLNLMKRIQVEQKIDEMVKRADEMMRQQEEIQKATSEMEGNDVQKAAELSRKQEEVDRQLEQMKEAMKDLREKMESFPKEMPLDKLEEAEQAANDTGMKQAIQQSAQQLRSMQMENAMTSQHQAAGKMQEMSDQLSEMQEQMRNNQMQQTMTALRKAMQDMLQLSQRQEQLKNQSRTLDPNSQQFKEMGRQQQNIQGDLANVANGLAELSQKSFVVSPEMGKNIGRAMAQMQQAMQGIEQRNGQAAGGMQGEAMASLNKSATLVQGAMESMQQSGGQGGGSLLQQLRNMAMQQQNINMQSQQIGEQQGLSQQQMQELGRLARQQEAVRKSLEQLQQEAKAAPEKNRILGDLQKISDEMKEVAEQMQQNELNATTIRQQERILSRLLQAQSSTRERDFEERRRATAGTAVIRKSPAELSLQTQESRLQRDLQRAMEAGYSKDYIELIRKYYEALNKNN